MTDQEEIIMRLDKEVEALTTTNNALEAEYEELDNLYVKQIECNNMLAIKSGAMVKLLRNNTDVLSQQISDNNGIIAEIEHNFRNWGYDNNGIHK